MSRKVDRRGGSPDDDDNDDFGNPTTQRQRCCAYDVGRRRVSHVRSQILFIGFATVKVLLVLGVNTKHRAKLKSLYVEQKACVISSIVFTIIVVRHYNNTTYSWR